MVPKLLTYTGRDCLSDMPSNPPPVFVFNVMFMGHMYQRSMLAHLEVPPTLGGVFRVALLIRGPWRSSHIGRVVVVAWVVSPVPSSSSYSRLQIRQISWNLMNKSSTGLYELQLQNCSNSSFYQHFTISVNKNDSQTPTETQNLNFENNYWAVEHTSQCK